AGIYVLRPVGALGPLDSRGSMGGAGEPACPLAGVALACGGRAMGERQRWIAARSCAERLPRDSERTALARWGGGHGLQRESRVERHSHGWSVCVAAPLLLVQREIRPGAGFLR